MNKLRLLAVIGLTTIIAIPFAHAAGLFNGYPIGNGASYCAGQATAGTPGTTATCVTTVPAGPALTGNEVVPADTAVPGASSSSGGGAAPATVLIPTSTVAGMTFGTPRNFLGNGDLAITQMNGTGAVTCATTSAPTTAAISADRWVCNSNVGSSVGRSTIITASPAPPVGFVNSMKVWRNSAALTQPVCVMQAIPTPQSTQLAGQQVTFSAYVAALAGLAADNGNIANMVIFAGTGSDQGLAVAPSTTPLITPAWTGITTVVNAPITLTTAFARFSTTATIPATATEVGVMLCFTPTAAGSGATDGFAFTGAQLEKSSTASLFEVRSKATETLEAMQYFYKATEGAASTIRAMCTSSTTSIEICGLNFPVPMYSVPVMGYAAGFASCTTTACTALVACTVIRTSTGITGMAPTVTGVPLDCTSTTAFPAAGTATFLADNGGTGNITAWTGF